MDGECVCQNMMLSTFMTVCHIMLQDPPIGRAQHLQSHHGEALEPQQLSRLLDWLMQASPAILVRPQASASSAMAGATRKDGEMMQWICQTVLSRDDASRSALHTRAWHQEPPSTLSLCSSNYLS